MVTLSEVWEYSHPQCIDIEDLLLYYQCLSISGKSYGKKDKLHKLLHFYSDYTWEVMGVLLNQPKLKRID